MRKHQVAEARATTAEREVASLRRSLPGDTTRLVAEQTEARPPPTW